MAKNKKPRKKYVPKQITGGDWAANPWVWVIDFKRIERAASHRR